MIVGVSSLPGAVQNERLTEPDAPVWKIDALPCRRGDELRVIFESDDGQWRPCIVSAARSVT